MSDTPAPQSAPTRTAELTADTTIAPRPTVMPPELAGRLRLKVERAQQALNHANDAPAGTH